jgi:hypothetical protein
VNPAEIAVLVTLFWLGFIAGFAVAMLARMAKGDERDTPGNPALAGNPEHARLCTVGACSRSASVFYSDGSMLCHQCSALRSQRPF